MRFSPTFLTTPGKQTGNIGTGPDAKINFGGYGVNQALANLAAKNVRVAQLTIQAIGLFKGKRF